MTEERNDLLVLFASELRAAGLRKIATRVADAALSPNANGSTGTLSEAFKSVVEFEALVAALPDLWKRWELDSFKNTYADFVPTLMSNAMRPINEARMNREREERERERVRREEFEAELQKKREAEERERVARRERERIEFERMEKRLARNEQQRKRRAKAKEKVA